MRRPAGHTFTSEELAGMSLAEFQANEDEIMAQQADLGRDETQRRRELRAKSRRAKSLPDEAA